MFRKIYNQLIYIKRTQHMQMALARGAATAGLRNIDPQNPWSWEFCGFSQNREDGIIDYLTRKLLKPNRYFVEIGASGGVENNTSWLAIARKFCGIMVEGDKKSFRELEFLYGCFNIGVRCMRVFIDLQTIEEVLAASLHRDPDIFSIDIDGNDYHIAEKVLTSGIRPKIFIVEYNATFGPDRTVTIPYSPTFYYGDTHRSRLYFGASVSAFRKLFSRHDYAFLSVDSSGTNAFFIDPTNFPEGFTDGMQGVTYQDNFYQFDTYRISWRERMDIISSKSLKEV